MQRPTTRKRFLALGRTEEKRDEFFIHSGHIIFHSSGGRRIVASSLTERSFDDFNEPNVGKTGEKRGSEGNDVAGKYEIFQLVRER